MEHILLASVLFLAIFSIDYLRHWLSPATYQYVSRETYVLYIIGVILAFVLFIDKVQQFAADRFHVELFYLLLIFFIALICSIGMQRQNIQICTTILRSCKCISPFYILIKSKELLLQQILFLVLAISVSREIGTGFLGLITFLVVVALIQLPLVFHVKRFWRHIYGGIMLFASVIFFYTYVTLELFWPAVYIHVIIYTFFWVTLAEPSPTLHKRG